MSVKKEFYKASACDFVNHYFKSKDGALEVETRRTHSGEKLIEEFRPYSKEVEVDEVKVKVKLIKYKATYLNGLGRVVSTEEKSINITDEEKRNVLLFRTATLNSGRTYAIQNLYADVLYDLDISDIEFIQKYWDDIPYLTSEMTITEEERNKRLYMFENRPNIGVKNGYVDFLKEFMIKRWRKKYE